MMEQDQVQAALRKLASHDWPREAPEQVESRVLEGFRKVRKQRRVRMGVAWSFGAAAAIGVALWLMPREQPAEPARSGAPQFVAVEQPDAEPVETVIEEVKTGQVVRRVRQPREIATEFFPLTDVAMPFERGEVYRVMVPAVTMRAVGLPVSPDRAAEQVQADVLVGEEGMARAIRFVRYEQ